MIKYKWLGTDKLANELRRKSEADFKRVEQKSLREMRDRAVANDSPASGGTPRDSGELRLSASVSDDTFGYTKDYAPHVEYGHRTRGGGFVPGQYYLQANVNMQRPIFRKDLTEEMRK